MKLLRLIPLMCLLMATSGCGMTAEDWNSFNAALNEFNSSPGMQQMRNAPYNTSYPTYRTTNNYYHIPNGSPVWIPVGM